MRFVLIGVLIGAGLFSPKRIGRINMRFVLIGVLIGAGLFSPKG